MRRRPVVGEATVPDAVRRLLDKFDYPDRESPVQTLPILPTLGGGGGAPSVVVAAADASATSKAAAHFQCTGVNDEITIQVANDSLGAQGGRVLATDGTFSIVVPTGSESTAAISLTAGVTLLGMGATANQAATYLAQANAGAGLGSMIRVRGGTVKDLSISTLGNATGIFMDDSQCKVCSINLANGSGHGVVIDEGAINDMTVCHSHFNMATGDAIHASDSGGSTPEGIYILNNYFEYGGTRSIYLGTVDGAVVAGNISEGSDEVSIYVDASVVNALIADNILKLAGFHGIQLAGVSDSKVEGNLIYRPSQITDNTYDGIFLSGNSDRNDIWNNKITGKSAANQPRYGINISAATCDDNSYLGNRTGPAADYGTGAYNDAGTGTINTWPGAAAPQGDNLL